ncbi:restriction endonuclease subunit R [Erwinia billingiae]|uniref:DEAD/DEAH box helicase n=1 Tax=Erwinia billingiae TaxID=182337 RepID=UPI0019D00F77|nr:DEAD/DEAH box helicase family protein [Erwinia billingiae]MBN7124116.1 restriction endonuclease subunit R [Erwinia billingiae]
MALIVPNEIMAELRDCQKKSIITVSNFIDDNANGSCLISLPTGAGKSGVICCVGHYTHLRRVLVVTHRRAVCDQLYRQIKRSFFEKILKDKYDSTYLKKKVTNRIPPDIEDGIYCTTFQKLTSLNDIQIDEIKDSFQLILIDEGHAEPSPKWGTVIRKFEAKKIIITATPYRNDLFSFDINVNHSYIYTYKDAIQDEVIVKPNFLKYDLNILKNVIKEYKQSHPGAVCIIKCKNFEEIKKYYSQLKSEFKVLAIHDGFKHAEVDHNLHYVPANIDKLDFEIYIHQRKLDEGIDLPQAKVLVLTYPVGSGKELVQTIGRVVRIYEKYEPLVIESDEIQNKRLWDNYLEFDKYLSNKSSAQKFLNTLNTASLLENYLDAFPEHSYFESSYKKKFDFNSFNPEESLIIPLASVCFINKLKDFDYNDLIDKIYWEFTKEGSLSKKFEEIGVITAVCFNNSKFLKDSLFFEPSLEIVIIKDLGDFLAIFDSSGRKFNNRSDLNLGHAVSSETLYKIIAQTEKSKTTQATSRAIIGSSLRAEGISYVGENLESTNHPQSNSGYAVTTAIASNLTKDNKIASSYYLGLSSGRISDQKFRKFNYNGFCNWVEDVKYSFESANTLKSDFLNSFSQAIDAPILKDPVACVIDFSSIKGILEVGFMNYKTQINNCFTYKKYSKGVDLLGSFEILSLKKIKQKILINKLIFKKDNKYPLKKIQFKIKGDEFIVKSTGVEFSIDGVSEPIEKILNTDTVKLLYDDGITYLDGRFYKFNLPSEAGMVSPEILNRIIALDNLTNTGLTEKDIPNLSVDRFGKKSIFSLIDMLSNVKDSNPRLQDLGEFYPFIPDVDLILCTDMDTEPADFVISSKTKLVYVHVKCGNTLKPHSSAGAITEVGSQALKNLHFLISQNKELEFANITRLNTNWPSLNGNDQGIKLDSRIRLFNKKYDKSHKLDNVLELIKQRRSMTSVKKEIWIVIGNAFSKSHFEKQFSNPGKISDETLQAYQLIDTWILQTSNYDVDVKFFVSK